MLKKFVDILRESWLTGSIMSTIAVEIFSKHFKTMSMRHYLSVHKLNSFEVMFESRLGNPPRKACSTCQEATAARSVVSRILASITGYLPSTPAKLEFSTEPSTTHVSAFALSLQNCLHGGDS